VRLWDQEKILTTKLSTEIKRLIEEWRGLKHESLRRANDTDGSLEQRWRGKAQAQGECADQLEALAPVLAERDKAIARAEARAEAKAYEWCADYIQGDVYSVSFHTTFTERAAEARKRAGERAGRMRNP
jgi:hypothetical protein